MRASAIRRSPARGHHAGFTLIELMVVMAIVALLVSIAAPRYFNSVDRAKENTLRTSLNVMRDALDQFSADKGRYPDSLDELVEARYLRVVPVDPWTGSAATWVVVMPADPGTKGKVYDVRSGMAGRARDGRLYADW
ncbi:MAG: prepilin-type N-terminal cleavage/methylation domain-containing protein [Rhizobiales bacterium]|nr:prepilin-type N-terminal cleavage/methylation domain-containing protein [Rhizobacter sp.]